MASGPFFPPILTPVPGLETRPEAVDRAKARELAGQFEALLLAQMLREMRESLDPDVEGKGLGASIMGDLFTTELSQSLSRQGGLGLAKYLVQALERMESGAVAPSPETAGDADSVERPVEPAAVRPRPEPPSDPTPGLTSAFGWRRDPFDGNVRFHAGHDLRVAYGQEVRAAAGGRVLFAGEQGGYGLTVVVDHGGGTETRYAHLSSIDVRAGDAIDAGQPIARSGQSGRVTGAHLHFEVRQDGRPVDPSSVEGLASVADLH